MRFKFFKVLSIALIVFGLMSAAVTIDDVAKGSKEDIVLGTFMSICFVLTGILIRRGLKQGYVPCWRLLVGGSMMFFAVTGLAIELDGLINNTSEDLAVGVALVGILSVSGFFLARSGYKRRARAQGMSIEEQFRTSLVSDLGRAETGDELAGDQLAGDETVAVGSFPRERK